jgi:hypothetical protein
MGDSKSQKASIRRKVQMKSRPSIATALSKRVKENVFKAEGIQGIENLIIKNLDLFTNITGPSNQKLEDQPFFRHHLRQQTVKVKPSILLKNKPHRNSSNFGFLNNAFVFQSGNDNVYLQKRAKTTALEGSVPNDLS